MSPMNLQINFEKPFMYWLTLQKYYTKFCCIKCLKVRFIVYKKSNLEVIFQHDLFKTILYTSNILYDKRLIKPSFSIPCNTLHIAQFPCFIVCNKNLQQKMN